MTLAHISLVFFVLPVAILVVIFRLFKTPAQAPETIHLKPDLAEVPSNAFNAKAPRSMPSLLYRPPTKPLEGRKHTPPAEVKMEQFPLTPQIEIGAKQNYDAFLVLDVEATCRQGTGFEWANEIIEWPVCLLRWKDKSTRGRASCLEVVGEFRTFVRPTWRPQLSQFCTDLTGITQAQVDYAPTFPKVLKMFAGFLVQHRLIDPVNGMPLQRFCWCSDGPFDVRDFVVKQCFISNVGILETIAELVTVTMPLPYLTGSDAVVVTRGDVLDVRKAVSIWAVTHGASENQINRKLPHDYFIRSLNITQQLHMLRLGPFQGRMHSGIDDTRNIARIVVELARRGIRLEPNTPINPNRRWPWMGRPGEVVEYCLL